MYEQGKVHGETLERLSNNFSLLQKNIEDFIETKRLAFPRFFFLNDTQFIDFLSKLKSQDNYDFYISQLFPGAGGFFFKKSTQDSVIPPQIINDISVLDQETVDEPRSSVRNLKALQKNIDVSISENLLRKSNKVYNYGTEKALLKEVLGMVSQTKELFLFEKKINITEKPESWLQKVEMSMQETIGKNINYAVASFPKQSLDEWILDHPQQIILTTIHLILTHEVNELFEEMRKTRKANRQEYDDDGEGEGSSYEDGDSHDIEDDEATPKTPNTRDLIKHSIASSVWEDKKSSQNSYRSSLRALKGRKGERKSSVTGENKELNIGEKYNQNINSGRIVNRIVSGIHESSTQIQAPESSHDSPPDERHKFTANMFGSDFDIDLVINTNQDDRDAVMDTLQEKSFRGLFLRLQFWINQICKSLHGKGREMELDLPVVHRIIMKSIV